MNPQVRTPTLAVALLALGCAGPRFAYEVPEPQALRGHRSLALDPRRDLAFLLDGLHAVPAGAVAEAVLGDLEAKGWTLAAPDGADLLVRVVALAPEASARGAAPAGGRGHGGGGAGRRGPAMEGGGGAGERGGPGRGSGERGSPERGPAEGGASPSTVVVRVSDRGTGRQLWHGQMDLGRRAGGADLAAQLRRFLEPFPAP